VDRFATEDGPGLIADGKAAGVARLRADADDLRGIVAGTVVPPQDPERLPAGCWTASGIQRALTELATGLNEGVRHAEEATRDREEEAEVVRRPLARVARGQILAAVGAGSGRRARQPTRLPDRLEGLQEVLTADDNLRDDLSR
jgi:hypothetical protein